MHYTRPIHLRSAPLSVRSNHTEHFTRTSRAVDNTDWLKVIAIILVSIDHFGYFFMEDDLWWSAVGRLAAPPFFFLSGFALSRHIPLRWVWVGIVLTMLESWNAGWTWVVPNILLSFVVIRIARPYVQILLQYRGWAGLFFLVCGLVAAIPIASKIVDYGSEGWLWALCGLCQRLYVDPPGATRSWEPIAPVTTKNIGPLRLVACIVAAAVYVWQEQREYSFPQLQFTAFVLGVTVLSVSLCLFQRGPSRINPPKAMAWFLRFVGRHTLEIYAIQLASLELLVKFVPDLAP